MALPTHFYRVFDNVSHSTFSFGYGFLCGDPNWPFVPRPLHFGARELLQHLDWRSRVPSRYISVYDAPSRAVRDAVLRATQPWRANVWVATVDVGLLMALDGSFVSTPVVMKGLGLTREHSKYLDSAEWFVFGQIPAAAVVRLDDGRVFAFKHERTVSQVGGESPRTIWRFNEGYSRKAEQTVKLF